MTRHDAQARARTDFEAALGISVRPPWIHGFQGRQSTDTETNGTILVRVIATSDSDIEHTVNNWAVRYWNVELLEDPDDLLAGIDRLWIYGPRYQFDRPATP